MAAIAVKMENFTRLSEIKDNKNGVVTTGKVKGIEIGRDYIRKEFKGVGMYKGIIQSYKHPYYQVVYNDGDQEDMVLDQIKVYLNKADPIFDSLSKANNDRLPGDVIYSTRPCGTCTTLRRGCTREWPVCNRCLGRSECVYPESAQRTMKQPHRRGQKRVKNEEEDDADLPLYSSRACRGCRNVKRRCTREWPTCLKCSLQRKFCDYPSHAKATVDPPKSRKPRQKSEKDDPPALNQIYSTRSCKRCRDARGKCPRTWPACNKCIKKGVECEYPADAEETTALPAPPIRQPNKPPKDGDQDLYDLLPKMVFVTGNEQLYSTRACSGCREFRRRCPREWPKCSKCKEKGTEKTCEYPKNADPTLDAPLSSRKLKGPAFKKVKIEDGAEGTENLAYNMYNGQLYASLRCLPCKKKRRTCSREWPACAGCETRKKTHPSANQCSYPGHVKLSKKRTGVKQKPAKKPTSKPKPSVSAAPDDARPSQQYATMRCVPCATQKVKCLREWPQCFRCVDRRVRDPDAPPCEYPENAEVTDKPYEPPPKRAMPSTSKTLEKSKPRTKSRQPQIRLGETQIRKNFLQGTFTGVVQEAVRNGVYQVLYEDGDIEEMETEQILQLMVPNIERKVPIRVVSEEIKVPCEQCSKLVYSSAMAEHLLDACTGASQEVEELEDESMVVCDFCKEEMPPEFMSDHLVECIKFIEAQTQNSAGEEEEEFCDLHPAEAIDSSGHCPECCQGCAEHPKDNGAELMI